MARAKEKWKRFSVPDIYYTTANYQVSNYGRVRNIRKDGSYRINQFQVYRGAIQYQFLVRRKENGRKTLYRIKATHLVAKAFIKGYEKGKFVVWKNYNRLDNYVGNLLCLDESEGRSHTAKGRKLNVKQEFVFATELETANETSHSPHRIELDTDYFKVIPGFTNYEVNRMGVIRRCKDPFKGRIISQRKHPDGLLIMDLRDHLKKKRTTYPHKLVAELWCINPDPERFDQVIHLDGNKHNNTSDNLIWGTKSDLMKQDFALGKRDNRKSWKTRKKLYGNGFKPKA